MEHELYEEIQIIKTLLNRIRQLLDDNVNEEALNDIFGEVPKLPQEEEPQETTKRKKQEEIIMKMGEMNGNDY